MDEMAPQGVASARPDNNSCQVAITHPDIRNLAAVGQVSDSPQSIYDSADKISSNKLILNDLPQTSPSSGEAPVSVRSVDSDRTPSQEIVAGPSVSGNKRHGMFRKADTQPALWVKSQGGIVLAMVDAEDEDRLGDYSWYLITTKQGKRYVVAHGECGRLLYLHREVLGDLPGRAQVDHKNGNTLDNRRENLRVATSAQNAQNRRKRSSARSRFKGVSPAKSRWMAKINNTYIGLFDTEEDAARAYDEAARTRFGEFALLNFPEVS